jgi:hypothetical protein
LGSSPKPQPTPASSFNPNPPSTKNILPPASPVGQKALPPGLSVNPKSLLPRQTPAEMVGNQIKRLTKAIKTEGFKSSNPIQVARIDGKLVIIDGHHRTAAAIRAGLREVPVKIIQVPENTATQYLIEAAEAAVYKR